MADFGALVNIIRRIVRETTEAHKPSGLYFGKVTSVAPIEITIDPKHILTEEFIVLGRYITEYSTNFTIAGETWCGLRPNDELMLIREQGGQRYAVVDWVNRVEEDDRPAWICEGEIVSVSPLEIKVNDYLTLTEDKLILCHSVSDHMAYLSFDNPEIKQKVNIWSKAEKEPLPATVRAGGEPHVPRPDDIPPPAIQKVTDIQFIKKPFESEPDGDLPAYHEITIYNRFEIGDRVMLSCERSLQKWFVVDFTYQVKQEDAHWID